MIVENFERFIDEVSKENASEDYWYDVGVVEAQNMLVQFSKVDWDSLKELIKEKSVEWKKKVVYCFEGENAEQEIRIIFDIIGIEDKELFTMCIDSLRGLVNEKTKNLVLEKVELLEKVRLLAAEDNGICQAVYMDFMKKVNETE